MTMATLAITKSAAAMLKALVGGAPIMEDTSVVARALSFHGNKHGCRRRVDAGK